MNHDRALEVIRALPVWQGDIRLEKLEGGRTNLNFMVQDAAAKYVVRLGGDISHHHVLHFNVLAAGRAAHAAGISPALVHAAPGVMVIEYIEARTCLEADIAAPGALERIIPLMHRCHRDVPGHLRGPALVFWVFHVIRDYAATLVEHGSSHRAALPEFLRIAATLEAASGPYEVVFSHNDMVAANILDDGQNLWLIDWDYAGFNTPLFDLGGLASNSGLDEAAERHMLGLYFGAPADDALFRRYQAMKCASLLREVMWSMVSEATSSLDVDYAAYTAKYLARFRRAHADFVNG